MEEASLRKMPKVPREGSCCIPPMIQQSASHGTVQRPGLRLQANVKVCGSEDQLLSKGIRVFMNLGTLEKRFTP